MKYGEISANTGCCHAILNLFYGMVIQKIMKIIFASVFKLYVVFSDKLLYSSMLKH